MYQRQTSIAALFVLFTAAAFTVSAQDQIVHVALGYGAPGKGPAPNFSPKGTQVALTDLPAGISLPKGAVRPARAGTVQVGSTRASWIPMLATADADHPADLCRIYLDRNRNGSFADDGPPLATTPTQNEKTKAWWSSFAKTELAIPYGRTSAREIVEPYLVGFWIVREGEETPAIARYSVSSWRTGAANVRGVDALVAVMDSNNDAVFDTNDMWSVLAATAVDAPKRVLTIAEARPTSRLMFIESGAKELVLEFRGLSADGRAINFAVVDRAITKKADRAPDDTIAAERSRPRTTTPFTWVHANLGAALKQAQATDRLVIVDFETTWCGPCKTMDEWIWNDVEVAARLNAGFVGVKLDGDLEKALVERFRVAGYPSGLVLDASGKELRRFVGYQSSKQLLDWLDVTR
jgi:thiol-disulfide isomerase/thioredoxin